MSKDRSKQRYDELKKLLSKYAYEYYVLEEPSVSDAIYDGLIRELKGIESEFPDLITPDSPTQRVGAEALPYFSKYQHSKRMLSLNDVFNRSDVEAWIKRTEKLVPDLKHEFFVDIKMDGLGCALIYEDGKLVQAATRGDGSVGEDVTNNVRTIKNIPLNLRSDKKYQIFLKGRTEIRGEIIILKKDFENLNKKREQEGLPTFANPRNLAAGSIRQLDPRLAAARPLSFRGYDLLREQEEMVPTHMFAYQALSSLGVSVNSQATVFKTVDEVMGFIDKWETARHNLPFNTDGLVVKLNDRKLYESLGVVGKNPRAAVAFKYPAEEATSQIKDIILSIGRTGAATPIAVFEPVVIAGTTVKHASLHNSDEIARKDIRVGDTVVIFKAGDIIPQVSKVLVELRPRGASQFNMEDELRRQYPELNFIRPKGEAVYRVAGATGPLLLKKSLEHFASKGALDIEGLGEKNVAALVDAGLVNDLADIYLLKKEQVEALERFADLSASNLIKGIKDSKRPSLPRFIFGLGIRHVGAQTAIDLSEVFHSVQKLSEAGLDELREVEGVGVIVAESIFGWFADTDNQKLLEKFEKLGVGPVYESRAGGELSGKSFVITGTLDKLGRDEAAEKIRQLGGTFQTSVGKDTTYLIIGENPGDSKVQKADQLGTIKMDEDELLKLIDK